MSPFNGRMSTASQGSTTATYQLQANSDWVQSVALEKGNDIATHWSHRDPAGRITGQIARRGSQPTGAILASAGYKYDSHGRREWLTREDGTRWEFGYNDRDEVQSGKKRLPNNGAYLAGQQFSYNYDDIGNRTTAQFGGKENGGGLRTISYTLDADHDPAAMGSVNQYRKIEYSGHVSLIGYGGATTQVLPSTPALLAETDQANQSNRWWRELQLQSPAESSGLFADLSFEENGVPLADAQGELWLNPTNYEPEYDLDGNLTSDARWDYIWNGENRLIRMTTKASAQATGHPWVRLTFAYDWQGRRVQKKVEENTTGNVTKDLRYLYDGWNLIAEYKVDVQSSQLTLQNSYLWGFDLSGTQQGAGGVGGLLAATQHEASNELCYFPSYDGNGNIIAWINEIGVVAQRNDYDPFGNLIAKQGDIEGLNYGFSTKYTDEETGLCYYGYRYYDPVTGRWPSRDPIGERGGLNLYGFVGNDGVGRMDYLGMVGFTENAVKNGHISYSCRCGWIDWAHTKWAARIFEQIKRNVENVQGDPNGAIFRHDSGRSRKFFGFYDPRHILAVEVRPEFSGVNSRSLAFAISLDVMRDYERIQSFVPFADTGSSFSVEDLTSNFLGIISSIIEQDPGRRKEFVKNFCGVLDEDDSEYVYHRWTGKRRSHSYYPDLWKPHWSEKLKASSQCPCKKNKKMEDLVDRTFKHFLGRQSLYRPGYRIFPVDRRRPIDL